MLLLTGSVSTALSNFAIWSGHDFSTPLNTSHALLFLLLNGA
jgi:hypothetical protein